MENQLDLIAKSYDEAIELGKKGLDLYRDLPEYIINDPDYSLYQKCDRLDSGCKEIRNYLKPNADVKFIDLVCCLNLMFRGYDKWPSIYYGIDISRKTIQLLSEFVTNKSLPIGSLYCGSIHTTPFESNYFDIGACIGVFEYFEKDFVEKAIIEIHRIMKPYGKFILDIPNIGNRACRIMMLIEEHLGRPDKFDMTHQKFEDMLQNCFEIEKKQKVETGAMIQYFLSCKK